MPHWHWTVCRKSIRSGRSARIRAEAPISFSCLRVRVRCSGGLVTRRLGWASGQISVGAEPGLQGTFQDLLYLVGLDAPQLPLQGGPLDGLGNIGPEAGRKWDACNL